VVRDNADDTVNDLETVVAALKSLLPACVALMVQVPAATRVTVVPDTVHTLGVELELKETLSELEALAETVKVPVPIVLPGKASKEIVWLAL
jgi:hypothetical protein